MHDHDETLTPEGAGKPARRTTRALAMLRYRGEGPRYYRVGVRSIRCKRSDVLRWIESGAVDLAEVRS